MTTNTEPLLREVGPVRVFPRRRRQIANAGGVDAPDQSVELVFSAPLEQSEVRRRFAGIYEQAYRITHRSE